MAVYSRDQMNIYFERGGDYGQFGDPLLFISGTGGDLRNKPNQFDSPLAKAFELIAYDQRGLGQSSKPPGDYSMRDYADDAASLLDYLELDCVPVVGVSFGGMVAQEFVLRHPDRVSRLVLACTSSGGKGNSSYPLHEIEKLEPAERASRHLEVSDLRRDKKWQQENLAELDKHFNWDRFCGQVLNEIGSNDSPKLTETSLKHILFLLFAEWQSPYFWVKPLNFSRFIKANLKYIFQNMKLIK